MIKTVAKLEVKIGDRFYQFFCDADSPLGEVKESLFQFSAQVASVERSAAEAAAKEEKFVPNPEVKEG